MRNGYKGHDRIVRRMMMISPPDVYWFAEDPWNKFAKTEFDKYSTLQIKSKATLISFQIGKVWFFAELWYCPLQQSYLRPLALPCQSVRISFSKKWNSSFAQRQTANLLSQSRRIETWKSLFAPYVLYQQKAIAQSYGVAYLQFQFCT